MNKNKKLLFLAFMGPVGTGKTYIAAIISKKIKASHIRTDNIRVSLRRRNKPINGAGRIAFKKVMLMLKKGQSVVLDSDFSNPVKQKQLRLRAHDLKAKFVTIKVKTPESLILKRLKLKKYNKKELFRSPSEAINSYFRRMKYYKNLQKKKLRSRPDFVILNNKPLNLKISKVAKKLRARSSAG